MKTFKVGRLQLSLLSMVFIASILLELPVTASPFGQGVFGADVPFGSNTSLTISLGGNVSLSLNPSGSNFTGNGSHTLTVTSNDVVGYRLYASSPSSTNMTNGTDIIPTSGNVSPAPLAVNSWGYNTDGSSNFRGILSTPTLIKDANGPYKNGDNTTITFGALTNITKSSGQYTVGVVYTAAAKNL